MLNTTIVRVNVSTAPFPSGPHPVTSNRERVARAYGAFPSPQSPDD